MKKEINQNPEGQKSPEEQKNQEFNRKEFLKLSFRSLIGGSLGLFSFLSSPRKAAACGDCESCESECDHDCQNSCESVCQNSCEHSCEDSCESSCEYECQIECQDTCEIMCQDTCEHNCQARCEKFCQQYCELHCEDHCEENCEATCEVSCQSHDWQNVAWEHNGSQHWLKQRCSCGASRDISYGSHNWAAKNNYRQIDGGDEGSHERQYGCLVCGRGRWVKEQHVTDADHITISYENDDPYGKAMAEAACSKCGHINHDNDLPALFSHKLFAGQANSNAYDSLVDAAIFTSEEPAVPFYNTGGYFPYSTLRANTDETNTSYNPGVNVPFIYIAQNGRLSLGIKQAEIDAYFSSEMRNITVPYQTVVKRETDKLYLKMQAAVPPDPDKDRFVLFYERNYETGEVTLDHAVLDSLSYADDGDYTSVKTLEFMEENHNGVTRYFNISFHFCDIHPGLTLGATDGSRVLSDAGPDAGGEPAEAATVYSKFMPQFNLEYDCGKGVLGEHDWVLNPLSWHRDNTRGRETFRLNRLETDSAELIQDADTPGRYAGAQDDSQFVLNNVTEYSTIRDAISAKGHNVNLAARYSLEVTARNIVGNLSKATFYFYLDDGVEADPVISWAYHLPLITVNDPDQRIFGKENLEEIDYHRLNAAREGHQITSVNIYDQGGYPAEEGFRGAIAGSAPNKSGVFILKDPDRGTDESNLIPAATTSLRQDSGYNNRDYHQVKITLGDFLARRPNPADREYRTSPLTQERITGEPGAEVYVRRETEVPVNIWNIPFRTKILVRDWIGNEKIVDAVVCDNPAFNLSLTAGSIYTPAYCPDVDITTVYITGANNEIRNNPQLAVNPPLGTPMEATFLPGFRAFAADYSLRVEDTGGGLVFPGTVFNTKGGPALVTGLGFGHEYHIFVTAQNANGYVTEPENAFRYTFTRNDLTITRSGVLTGDEVWNWHYRLIGDIIIPSGRRLSIFPGGSVLMPKIPAVFADKRSKFMVKTGGTLIIDGSVGSSGSFDPAASYLQKDKFINLVSSGLDSRLNSGGLPETVYSFDGKNNWGGIYFEAGYDAASYIRRARICGAYDGVLVFGGSPGASGLEVAESVISANYIGIHALSPGRLKLSKTVIDANLEYGIKTEGSGYIMELADVKTAGPPNRLADYYSSRLHTRLDFSRVQNDREIKKVEEGKADEYL